MIKSMTGYGKANLNEEEREYQIEIKTVNHRYLDISVKMPKQISYLEETIKKEVSKQIKRGKVDIYVTFNNSSIEGKSIKINTQLAKAYISELKKLAEEEKILADIQVNDIAKYPEVLTVEYNQEDEIIPEYIEDMGTHSVIREYHIGASGEFKKLILQCGEEKVEGYIIWSNPT